MDYDYWTDERLSDYAIALGNFHSGLMDTSQFDHDQAYELTRDLHESILKGTY